MNTSHPTPTELLPARRVGPRRGAVQRALRVLGRALGAATVSLLGLLSSPAAWAEDGYALWLRYAALEGPALQAVRQHASRIVTLGPDTPTLTAAVAELQRGIAGLTGRDPAHLIDGGGAASREPLDGALLLITPQRRAAAGLSPALAAALREPELSGFDPQTLGAEGFHLRRLRPAGPGPGPTVIVANTDLGLLYGSFAWLRAAQTGADLATLDQRSVPRLPYRLLNHWDNLDRSVERGYAGSSLWDWWALPDIRDARHVDYARANASLGLNGAVLNNVNAKALSLTGPWLAKAAALADVLRPYGVRVYLSARFSAPVELGGLRTADPLDPAVRAWWRAKADEIYRSIPDFGGFLVKANSEGQPGPQDYGRSHADGANALAEALAPHGGLVIWRAFVYRPVVQSAGGPAQRDPQNDARRSDRARQAFDEFEPLDGRFAPNVVLQVKNGPIDFQPREPFHPLFGAMPRTRLGLELQITKEYLGFATHLAYLGPLFEEVLKADTRRAPAGAATVARVIGGLAPGAQTGLIAGVANTGTDRNWTGSHFDQANWYAFGRLAWAPELAARDVAREWAHQTWSGTPRTTEAIVELMMASREAVVDYMTPLGLHHLMGSGHHHGPAPWVDDLERPDWNPVYYHRADRNGIGFERGPAGSDAISQYAAPLARAWADPATTPEPLLLWFHRLSWDHRLASGQTLWEALIAHYDRGVATASDLRRRWEALRPAIDARRHAETAERLAVQEREARWWRDACLAYFQSVSGRPWPPGVRPPEEPLEAYRARRFDFAPGLGH